MVHYPALTYVQLPDDGSCPPAVVEGHISQVTVGVVAKVQKLLPVPTPHLLQLLQVALRERKKGFEQCLLSLTSLTESLNTLNHIRWTDLTHTRKTYISKLG